MSLLTQIKKLYGINDSQLIKVNDGFQNSIYVSKDLIIRISNPARRSLNELKSELVYISALAQSGVSVSVPLLSKKGHLIEVVQDHNRTFFVIAFEKAKGLAVNVTEPTVWNEELFLQWGRIIGKMHHLSKQLQGLNRPVWSNDTPDILNLEARIKSDSIAERYLKLLDRLKGYEKNSEIFGIIHNDFHQGNFFVDNGKITLFDFDDCVYHWFAYDFAVSFYHAYWQASSFTPENIHFSEVYWTQFLNGYKTEHTIHREIIEQIPIFLKIREVFLYVLFLEKWDMKEEWQVYTINDLKYKIENDIPYSNINFQEIIDSLV